MRAVEGDVRAGAGAGAEAGAEAGAAGCTRDLIYDKPFKTGSTAISCAARRYLAERAAQDWGCGRKECLDYGREMCEGRRQRRWLVGHFLDGAENRGESTRVMECLRAKGFYVVTSVREPAMRWRSMFLFNRMMKGSHYGVDYRESYRAFVGKVPGCNLHQFYDGRGVECNGKAEERTRAIVGRYDEVIDLYDAGDGGGELMRRIGRHVRRENVSAKKGDGMEGELDEETLAAEREATGEERLLYEALKERGRAGGDKRLCEDIGTDPAVADAQMVRRVLDDGRRMLCPGWA